MGVYAIDPLRDPRWPEFLQRNPRASVFHTPGWLEVLKRAYGYEPVAYTTSTPGAELANGWVFCRVRSWLTGRRLVSLPFSDHCDPLVEKPEHLDELSRALRPVTTTQDYMLFYLLGERSIELWKKQIELILDKNGCISFIVHPDYVMHDEIRSMYKELLNYVRELQAARGLCVTLPAEVDRWWRARSKMQLVPSGNGWHVEGDGAERAVLAYARSDASTKTPSRNVDGKLVYETEAKRASVARSQPGIA